MLRLLGLYTHFPPNPIVEEQYFLWEDKHMLAIIHHKQKVCSIIRMGKQREIWNKFCTHYVSSPYHTQRLGCQ